MQRFVVVASSGSPTIDQRALGLLSDPAPAVLPFDPHQHDHWCSSTGRVHVASWSAHETVSPTDRAVEGGIAALGGLPIVTQPSDAAAFLRPADVTRQLSSLEALTRRLDGPYALVALGPDGTGTAVNDPFGLHPLYVGEFGPSKVLGDDAALVAAVLEALSGCCPEPDEDVVAWLLLNGQMFGDATPYRGVRRLPFGSGAALRSDGEMTVVPWHEPPWSPTAAPAGAFDEAVDLAEQRMIATVRAAVAEAPGAVVSELTAGRDSRLVLELVRGRVSPTRCCSAPTARGIRRIAWSRPRSRATSGCGTTREAGLRSRVHRRSTRSSRRSDASPPRSRVGSRACQDGTTASRSPASPARACARTIRVPWA